MSKKGRLADRDPPVTIDRTLLALKFSQFSPGQNMKFKFSLFFCVLFLPVFSAIAETPKAAREPVLTIEKPSEMMRRWLLAEALKIQKKWESDFDAIQTPEQVRAYSQAWRKFFWKAIDGQPEGGKTPLNAQLRGTI